MTNYPKQQNFSKRLRDLATRLYTVERRVQATSLPTGSLSMYAGSDPPGGFLICNGQAVSRGDYAALFEVIGTTYGNGNGSTTFNVPDLRRRFPIGEGDGWPLGSNEGETTVGSRTTWHSHGSGNLSTTSNDYGGSDVDAGSGSTLAPNAPRFRNHSHNVGGSTGSALGLDNFPNLAVNFIIKA